MRKAYVLQECNRCGHAVVLEYRSDGSYKYTTPPCECEDLFSPVNNAPSLSEWLESLKENKAPEKGTGVKYEN